MERSERIVRVVRWLALAALGAVVVGGGIVVWLVTTLCTEHPHGLC